MTLRLHTFGSVYLSRDGEILSGAAGQRRLLAILSILATVGDRGMSRDKLLSLLWSDGEPEKSRHALTQSLYHIRKALDIEKLFLSGADVRLNPGVLSSDVADFQRAIVEQRLAEAVGVYRGAFLDGFYLNGDPDFEFWVAAERDRFSRQYASALEKSRFQKRARLLPTLAVSLTRKSLIASTISMAKSRFPVSGAVPGSGVWPGSDPASRTKRAARQDL